MVMLVSLLQPENAELPILDTLFGMVDLARGSDPSLTTTLIVARLVQPENAELPILDTLFGMVTVARLVQPENAELPILDTLFGMVTTVTVVLLKPKIELKDPTFCTEYPPNSLGIVTAPVAFEAVIVAPPFSI